MLTSLTLAAKSASLSRRKSAASLSDAMTTTPTDFGSAATRMR